MTAPVAATTPHAPAGQKMPDGFPVLVSFSGDPDIDLWEVSVTPPGLDGGDMIDITTQHNSNVRTFWPRALITVTDSSFVAGFDPVVYTQLLALINDPQTVTIHFPNGGKLAWFGVVRMAEAAEEAEGDFPNFTVTVSSTNTDPVSGDEELPVYTPPTP